ncbi:MFS transporter [Saccharomonospora cyanea]|uniref:Arabinose efflux permease family protein n=1 Tax=Saccharomonospora cyanea NA-134 TaxID=882082 RepID=H5XD69_9PSEU|nr:MFS transporter [Saccharomonospora cyanea]EHR59149.1 arabinose efflux permease family protein [Saccharomonospora cyanea NA-134]
MKPGTTGRAGRTEWAGLGVLALPTLLLGLDATVLYQAVPVLSADLRPSGTQTLWIMDSYGLLIAGFLITMGSLGDRYGHRRMLLIGSLVFGATSVVAAYSVNAGMLIAARAALGIAGATLMPSTLALVRTMFTDTRQRGVAIGIWATMFALGMAAGPVVGGVLLEHFWWGAAFLVALPVVVLVVALAPLLLPDHRARHGGRIDLFSVALSLGAMLPLVYTVKHLAADGVRPPILVLLAGGLVCAVVFVRRQRTLAEPLLDLSLLTNRALASALTVLLLGLVCVGGVMYVVTQYLQLVDELSPLIAGAWLGPPALLMFVAALAAPLVARRVPPGHVVAGALGLSAIGHILLTQVDGPGRTLLVVSGFGLVYLGLGAIAALGTDLVVGAAPRGKAGSAAALSETVQELGIAVGVAFLGTLTTAVYRSQVAEHLPAGLPDHVDAAVRDSLADATAVSPPTQLLTQAKLAFTSGLNSTAVLTCVITVVVAVLAATTLRRSPADGPGHVDAPLDARHG